jgi:hypothetical protein
MQQDFIITKTPRRYIILISANTRYTTLNFYIKLIYKFIYNKFINRLIMSAAPAALPETLTENENLNNIPPGQWTGPPDENGITAGEEFYTPN